MVLKRWKRKFRERGGGERREVDRDTSMRNNGFRGEKGIYTPLVFPLELCHKALPHPIPWWSLYREPQIQSHALMHLKHSSTIAFLLT